VTAVQQTLTFTTSKRLELIDITRQVASVEAGKLLLGTWQEITLVKLDGPRKREIVVDVRA
jgi:thiamine phosphate synthase YjbQ (UPF0047 family)